MFRRYLLFFLIGFLLCSALGVAIFVPSGILSKDKNIVAKVLMVAVVGGGLGAGCAAFTDPHRTIRTVKPPQFPHWPMAVIVFSTIATFAVARPVFGALIQVVGLELAVCLSVAKFGLLWVICRVLWKMREELVEKYETKRKKFEKVAEAAGEAPLVDYLDAPKVSAHCTRRLFALLIDSCVPALMLIATLFFSVMPPAEAARKIAWFFMLIVPPLYFFICEASFGGSLGKSLVHLTVQSKDGSRLSFGRVLVRSLARFVPFDSISALFSRERIAFHDRLSGTYVTDKP